MTDEHRRESDPRIDKMERGFEDLRVTTDRVLVILDGKEELNASGEVARVGGISKDVAGLKVDVADLKVAMNGGKMGVKRRDKVTLAVIAITPALLMYLNTVAGGR